MRAVICGGIRYRSVAECEDRNEYTMKQLVYALTVSGHIGGAAVAYADSLQASTAEPEPVPAPVRAPEPPRVFTGEALLPRLCTHRLGVHHGGRY